MTPQASNGGTYRVFNITFVVGRLCVDVIPFLFHYTCSFSSLDFVLNQCVSWIEKISALLFVWRGINKDKSTLTIAIGALSPWKKRSTQSVSWTEGIHLRIQNAKHRNINFLPVAPTCKTVAGEKTRAVYKSLSIMLAVVKGNRFYISSKVVLLGWFMTWLKSFDTKIKSSSTLWQQK